jgi:hypothetical protein
MVFIGDAMEEARAAPGLPPHSSAEVILIRSSADGLLGFSREP